MQLNTKNDVVILAAKRSPMGAFQGSLASLRAPEIAAKVIRSLSTELEGASHKELAIDEVLMGNVISAGIGQAPARQAALLAGLAPSIPCTTISKVCGSGMQALMSAYQSIALGEQNLVLAGGMESMSNAPYILPRVRAGLRLGHSQTLDAMFLDGLEDAETGKLMGHFGQLSADAAGFSREAMDDYAIESLHRARNATDNGLFENQIIVIELNHKGTSTVIKQDEQVLNAKPEKIRSLKPAFKADGTLTAANSSSISDGAAALLVASADTSERAGFAPIARIVAISNHAQLPAEFTSAPIPAIEKALKKASWTIEEVDLFEINEAFALVPMLAMKALNIPHDKVNVHGGACALGHPLGASGARIVVTLIHALQHKGLSKGIAAICIGGGEATAIAVELVN